MNKKKQIESGIKILNQTVYIGGYTIRLNFLPETNEEIGPAIRSILLSGEANANTLDN